MDREPDTETMGKRFDPASKIEIMNGVEDAEVSIGYEKLARIDLDCHPF